MSGRADPPHERGSRRSSPPSRSPVSGTNRRQEGDQKPASNHLQRSCMLCGTTFKWRHGLCRCSTLMCMHHAHLVNTHWVLVVAVCLAVSVCAIGLSCSRDGSVAFRRWYGLCAIGPRRCCGAMAIGSYAVGSFRRVHGTVMLAFHVDERPLDTEQDSKALLTLNSDRAEPRWPAKP